MSTENKSLKFIHLGSGVAAADKVGGYAAGSIIFEPKSGRIAVSGDSGLEYYGGGRIADAKFEKSILTISFNISTTFSISKRFVYSSTLCTLYIELATTIPSIPFCANTFWSLPPNVFSSFGESPTAFTAFSNSLQISLSSK